MPKYKQICGRIHEFTACKKCWQQSRTHGRDKKDSPNPAPKQALFQCIGGISIVQSQDHPVMQVCSISCRGRTAIVCPEQYVFDGPGIGWRKGEALEHPTLNIRVTTDINAYCMFGLPTPKHADAHLGAIANTGAQVCLMGLGKLHKMGLQKQDLLRADKRITAANKEEITILGAALLHRCWWGGAHPHHRERFQMHITILPEPGRTNSAQHPGCIIPSHRRSMHIRLKPPCCCPIAGGHPWSLPHVAAPHALPHLSDPLSCHLPPHPKTTSA